MKAAPRMSTRELQLVRALRGEFLTSRHWHSAVLTCDSWLGTHPYHMQTCAHAYKNASTLPLYQRESSIPCEVLGPPLPLYQTEVLHSRMRRKYYLIVIRTWRIFIHKNRLHKGEPFKEKSTESVRMPRISEKSFLLERTVQFYAVRVWSDENFLFIYTYTLY